MWLFIAKIVVIGIVVMWFAYKLSIERGLPIVLILLAILVLVFGTLRLLDDVRPRCVRDRRQ